MTSDVKSKETMNTRVCLYENITNEELAIVDGIAKKLGYTNRTGLLTDLLDAVIYGRTFRKEMHEVNDIIALNDEIDHPWDEFMKIIEEYVALCVSLLVEGLEKAARVSFPREEE